jgi:hypothetical protein
MTLATLGVTTAEIERPPAYIKNITLSTSGNDLVVALDFALKQFFSSRTTGPQEFAARQDLRDRLYVLLVATTEKSIALRILKEPSILTNYLVFNDTDTVHTKVLSLNDSRININDTFNLRPTELGSVYGTDLPFNEALRFRNNTNPNYLSLFAVSFLNLSSDEASEGVGFNNVAFGKLSSELIIKGGTLNTSSLIFYKNSNGGSNATMWVGSVHKDRHGQWRSGPMAAPPGADPLGALLYAKSVYNTKISDNRNVERMEKLQLNFNNSALLAGATALMANKLKALEAAKTQTITYVSDAYYSKSEENNLRFYFGINFLDIVKQNGRYATLYKSPADLLTSCNILSFNIIRRRVKEGNIYNKLTGGDSPFRMYDDKIDIIGPPTRANIAIPNQGIMHYIIADPEMNDITTGLYEYGVEIEVLDNTREKFVNIVSNLSMLIIEIEDFLTQSLAKGNYNGLLNRYTPGFLSKLKKVYGAKFAKEAPWVKAIEVYASALTMLFGASFSNSGISTDSMIDDLLMVATPTTGSPEGLQYLVKLLQGFISALRTSTGITTVKKPGGNETLAMPSNKLSSKKRIFKIRQFFETPFDADSLVDMGLDFLNMTPDISNVNNTGLKYISLNQWESIAANQANKNNNIIASSSVAFLTPNFLRLPVGSPVNLYSPDGATRQDVDKLTYQLLLANMERNSPIIFEKAPDIRTERQVSRPAASMAATQTAVMNANGCVASATSQTAENPITNMFEDTEDLTPQRANHTVLEDSNTLFSADSSFAHVTTGAATISGSTDTALIRPGTSPSDANRQTDVQANVSLIANYLVQSDFFNGAPGETRQPLRGGAGSNYLRNSDTNLLQFRAGNTQRLRTQGRTRGASAWAAAFSSDPDMFEAGVSPQEVEFTNMALSGALSPEDLPSNAIKYGFIYTVEYLASYKFAFGGSLIKNPVWLKLDAGILAAIQGGQQTLLCRLRKHSTLISDFNGLKTPVYNELFIIGHRDTAPSALSNPLSLPMPQPVRISSGVIYSVVAEIETMEYSNSYDVEAQVGRVTPAALANTMRHMSGPSSGPSISPEGNTTINNNHRHRYNINKSGNGIAHEVCSPENSNNCHTHQIIRRVVQTAGDHPHTHRIVPSQSPSTGNGAGSGGTSGNGYG